MAHRLSHGPLSRRHSTKKSATCVRCHPPLVKSVLTPASWCELYPFELCGMQMTWGKSKLLDCMTSDSKGVPEHFLPKRGASVNMFVLTP